MQEESTGRERAAHEDVDELTALFQEFVGASEAGDEPELAPFLARAGSRAGELRRRVALLRALRELGELGREDAFEPLEQPSALGRFRVLGLLGTGGLSRVFLAEDPALGRRVALKVLSEARFLSREARGWIRNEGQVLARLRHPGVVRVLELGEAEGLPFLVMELVEGPSLGEVLAALRDLRSGAGLERHSERALRSAHALRPLEARVGLALALARALAACHEAGVLHRDLKPSNVLLEGGLEPRLIDFGLGNLAAREESLTDVTQSLVGTPAHLSPEQVEAGRTLASAASDQFALGTLLYELFTLQSPFARGTRTATLAAIAAAAPKAPRRLDARIPVDLERIVLQALGREPRDRYASVADLAGDLQAFHEHRAIRARPPSAARSLQLWARRHRKEVRIALVAALLLLLLGPARALWDQLRERAALDARIEEQLARIERTSEPEAFANALRDLERLEEAARTLQASSWAFLTAATVERVNALREALCPRLALAFEQASAGIEGLEPSTRAGSRAELAARWGPVVAVTHLPCPDEDAVRRLWELGTVELGHADGLQPRLLRHQFNAGLTPTPLHLDGRPNRPGPGLCRARWLDRDGRLVSEYDLLVEAGAPRRRAEPRAPDPAWIPALVELPAASVRLKQGSPEEQVAAVCVRPRPVCKQELRTGLPCETDCGHAPAQQSFEQALEFATRHGLRLPTVQELLSALRDPRSIRPDDLRGELVAGGESPMGRMYVTYPPPDGSSESPRYLLIPDDHAIQEGYGFRLACAPELIE